MSNLGSPKINLTKFLTASPVHEINGVAVDAMQLMNSVSMVSMKLGAENVESVKALTTEGLSKKSRIESIQKVREHLGRDVFELSTCNRVLYVGFGCESQELEQSIFSVFGIDDAPFQHYSGIDVWRQLVKVCSGLDSFILGELQVMSQFRGAVAMHRKNGLVSDINSSFFDHVVSANRMLRKEFGFTQTTESMLNLATTAIEELLSEQETLHSVVLGFGDMGCKAVETLLEFGQNDITVVTRNPESSSQRHPEISSQVNIISFDDWTEDSLQPSLIISTIRNIEPTYNSANLIPSSSPAKIMDFSWPPSIDASGVSNNQELLGMEYWIKVARKVGMEWNYASTIGRSDILLTNIQNRFMAALTDRTQAKFRAYIYSTLETLAEQWNQSSLVREGANQLGPFSREIATWICNQEGPFETIQLDEMVHSTDRPINPTLLSRVARDVTETIVHISEQSTLPEATS
tara:strand:- start:425 stop:1813 length:1389 start_codon:yes stop_codon:yes gene_type:complete